MGVDMITDQGRFCRDAHKSFCTRSTARIVFQRSCRINVSWGIDSPVVASRNSVALGRLASRVTVVERNVSAATFSGSQVVLAELKGLGINAVPIRFRGKSR